MKSVITRYSTSLVLLLLVTFSFVACVDDAIVESKTTTDSPFDESDLQEAKLTVDVEELNVYTGDTRAAEPSSDTETATDDEKQVDDIWVFQYDASTNELLIRPRYYTAAESQNIDGSWDVVLKDMKSNIYVVTNTQNNEWASDYTNFGTVDDLKQQALINPDPIVFGDNSAENLIPMGGITGDAVVPSAVKTITVPVTRMYAKLKIKVKLADILDDYYDNVQISYVNVSTIPHYCRVGSLAEEETGGDIEGAVDFPNGTEFVYKAFTAIEDGDGDDDDDDDSYPYVVYVPETLRGESENTDEAPEEKSNAEYTPTNALAISVRITYWTKASGEDEPVEGAVIYTVYPGGNNYNNYNIRRNNVYRIKMDVGYPLEETPEPSANCICGFAGETLVFYPYYRVEIGGQETANEEYYTFSNYLDPTDADKEIVSLKIIWQTENCIGDNSDGDLVKLRKSTVQDNPIYQYKIYVTTKSEGNALIGAYNREGDIIWSWHIWVRDKSKENDPTNIANAMTYYTYDWDEDGIYPERTRILGYPIMNCNVGALSDDNATGDDTGFERTLGVLYQWGRKDPFPPGKGSNLSYGYDESHIKIVVYDNEHHKIDMTNNDGCPGTGDSYKVFNTILANEVEGYSTQKNADVLKYSIQNPTMFIATYTAKATAYTDFNKPDVYIEGSQCDWLPVQDDYLWGGTDNYTKSYTAYSLENGNSFTATLKDNYGDNKTIFDPCPYGWRVSPGDIWVGFTSTGKNTGRINTSPYDVQSKINCADASGDEVYKYHGYHMYMQGWHQGETSFFPIQGTRQPSGQMQGYKGCGNYHNATAEKDPVNIKSGDTTYKAFNRRVDILHIHGESTSFFVNTFDDQLRYTNRTIGCPIRCVRETK